ncbi:MAG: hypothetical protein JO202_14965 [Ktedonobacteraceae bacterium]|nr:hypothetical protein [Ktedonobacteraceae bacterium]
MERRHGSSDDPEETPSGVYRASLNGTGKHRPIPQRPPGMARVDHPPSTSKIERPYAPKVARPEPQRVDRPPRQAFALRNLRRHSLLILPVIFVICALLACGIGYAAFNYANGLNMSNAPALVASDFLVSLSHQDYDQAYKDLGVTITLQLSPTEFAQQAKNADRCYGQVTNYVETSGSAVNQGNSQSYGYTVGRSKLAKPYQLRLTLQQNQDTSNSWRISSYGGNLGPDQAVC